MAQPGTPDQGTSIDHTRLRYGWGLIVIAFVFLGIVFLVAVTQFDEADEVTAVVGAASGTVGSLTGAFFGLQFGAAGRERAEASSARHERAAVALAAAEGPEETKKVVSDLYDLPPATEPGGSSEEPG
jgi:hypothetical protein